MTDIEKKALATAVEAAGRRIQDYNIMAEENVLRQSIEAHARAIEQHEAFRQEVSEFALGVKGYMASVKAMAWQSDCDQFIIAKPVDPFVALVGEAVWNDPDEPEAVHCAASILAGLKTLGLEVRKIGEGE